MARPPRRCRRRRRRRRCRGRQLQVAGQLQHRAGHPAVGGLQRGLAGQPGGVPGQPELRPATAGGGGHLVDVDVVGQHPQPGAARARPTPWRTSCWPAAAVSAWPCGATASGEFARMPACTPAQCSGTDHSGGLPRALKQRERLVEGVLTAGRSGAAGPAATHSSPSGSSAEQVDRVLGEHLHRRRTSASAPPRCRRLRRAIAGLQRGGPQRIAPVQVRHAATRGDVGGGRGQLPVLHPDPAEQQAVPVGDEPSSSPRAADGAADDAARSDGVAAVQRRQRDERRGRVGGDARRTVAPRHRLRQPGDGHRVRPVERLQQSLGQTARCPGGRRRRTRAVGAQRARGPPRRRRRRAATTAPAALTTASGYGPSQRNSSAAWAALPSCSATLAAIRTAAARSRGVVGGEQLVGESARGAHSRRSAPARRRAAR